MLDGCGVLIPPLLHFIWQKLTFDGSDIIAEIISASNAASPPATVDQIGRTSEHRQRENDPSDGEHPSSSTLGGMSYSSGIPAEGLPLRTEDLGKLPVHSLPSGYTNAEAQAPAYHMPVLSEGFQYPGFDSQPNDPVGSTGIPFRIGSSYLSLPSIFDGTNVRINFWCLKDNSFWGPGTTPAHAALAMFNGAYLCLSSTRWDDWGAFIANVDELLRSLDPQSYFEMQTHLTAALLSNGVLCLNQLLILKTETPQTRSIVQNDS
ncbi:hypothetical protein F5876DRAFT_75090 [Lentinula aff. lateritia]|uniref:Uncharacterized protein n=1 Tax=Lentinula aff. lateritia TaxID=2804960 RepID=A0ACC1U5V0_9AGAR|nr:hypothetical protein F5876DRAFT_75090 [Lentinula aff. lateritia]